MNRPVRVFLSYSRADLNPAGQVASILSRYAAHLTLWMDQSLEGGEQYSLRIFREIDGADVFLALVSDEWRRSDWCQREARHALGRVNEGLLVIPLRIYGEGSHLAGGLSHLQCIDLADWRVACDRIIREQLIPLIVPSLAGPRLRRSPAVLGLATSAESVLVWAAQHSLPNDAEAGLLCIGYDLASDARLEPHERARLLGALAGLHLTRREWRDMEGAVSAGLTLVLGVGSATSASPRAFASDAVLIGDLLLLSVLGARQRGAKAGFEQTDRIRAWYGAIGDPLLRADKLAQLSREVGTWMQMERRLDEARTQFRASEELLVGIPSQRLHLLQARIKRAQVELMAGDVAGAAVLLEALRSEFEGESDVPLFAQVLPHFLVTDALLLALQGRDEEASQQLGRLDAASATYAVTEPFSIDRRAHEVRLLLSHGAAQRAAIFRTKVEAVPSDR